MAPAPKTFTELVAFIAPKLSSIPENPTGSDMLNFAAACNTEFVEEYGAETDVNSSTRFFQMIANMVPVNEMDGVIDAMKQMEE